MSPVHTRRLRAVLGAVAAAAIAVAGLVATAAGSNAPSRPRQPIRGAGSSDRHPRQLHRRTDRRRGRPAETRATTQSLATSYDVKVREQFSASIKGFSASMSEEQAKKMAGDQRVAFVQQNQKFTANQDNPPWGLDRSDQRDLPLDKKFEAASHRRERQRLRDRHRHLRRAQGLRRPRLGRHRHRRRRPERRRLHGPRQPRGRHHRRYEVRAGQGREGLRRPGARLQRLGFDRDRRGRDRVGDENAKKPAVANMSLGGGADDGAGRGGEGVGRLRRHLCRCCWQRKRRRLRGSPAKEPSAITVGATDDQDRRRRSPTGASASTCSHPGVDIESAGITDAGLDGQDERYVDGDAARRRWRSRSTWPTTRRPSRPMSRPRCSAPRRRTRSASPGTGSPNKLLFVGKVDPASR